METNTFPERNKSNSILLSRTWFLLWNCVCNSLFISSEFINLISLSNLIWPNESFHALELGAMIGVRLWINAIFGLIWGWAVDHYSQKEMYCLGTTFTGFVLLLNAFISVGNGMKSYWEWIWLRIFLGIANGHAGPAIHAVSNNLLQKTEKSQFFGQSLIANTLTQMGGMLFSSWLFQIGLWQIFYLICGMFYLISSFFLWNFLPSSPRNHKNLPKLNVEKNTMMFSKSNLLIILEGIFTNLIFGIVDLVSVPYIQSPPHNLSSTNTSVLLLLYGIPGSILGSLVFSKKCDKHGSADIHNRVKYIISALILAVFFIGLMFIIPLPSLSKNDGSSINVIFSSSAFLGLGFVYFALRLSFALYTVNQGPIIQEINLTENQGQIHAWNHLLEVIAYASGPIIAGILLQTFGQNYFVVVIWLIGLSFPGIVCWGLIYRIIGSDYTKIKSILNERSSSFIRE